MDRIFRFAKSMIRQVFASTLIVEDEPYVMDNIGVAPTPLFDSELVNWSQHQEDSKCVLWIMDTSADADMLLFAFRFAADIVWYPETATSLCPSRIADLFFDCFLDGAVIPGAEERMNRIARILASILNIHACTGHDLEAVSRIGERISDLQWNHEEAPLARWSLELASCKWSPFAPDLHKGDHVAFCV